MNILLNGLLLIAVFISFVPVINITRSSKSKKYRCLKYLIFITFSWTLIILIERLLTNYTVVYYSHLLTYPLKFGLAAAMLCTIFDYIEMKIPKWLFYVLVILFVGELILALTNGSTLFILQINASELNSFKDLYSASKGSLFIVHLLITYIVLLSAIVYLFVFLKKHIDVLQYRAVTKTMAISSFIVLLFNIIQLIFLKSEIDLTYVSLVIVVYTLYRVIYSQDMIFNLRASGRGEILSNMREMYIITDDHKRIVEVSGLLISKYDLESDFTGKPLNSLIKDLERNVVFYSDIEVQSTENPNKDHLHMREKKFQLKGMNQFGYMILLYDETQVFNLLRELNRLSNYDMMTGLNNRNFIEHYLDKIKDTKGYGIVSLDLNGLKINNDYLGHERGDYLLKKLADKIKLVCKNLKQKEIARIGGDEFLVVLPKTVKNHVEKIKNLILEECQSDDIEEHVSVSIGVAYGSDSSHTIFELIQQADQRMYEMKRLESKKYAEEIVSYVEKRNKYIR
jgi:diguanylate cyclase (GGDEF)-like protein